VKSSVISTNQMPSKHSLVERKTSHLVEKVIGFFLWKGLCVMCSKWVSQFSVSSYHTVEVAWYGSSHRMSDADARRDSPLLTMISWE
jgi:hypothetical protein